jgi:hypothetical protein
MSPPVRASQSPPVNWLAVTIQRLFELKEADRTGKKCPRRTCSRRPVPTSHTRPSWSSLAVTRRFPFGENSASASPTDRMAAVEKMWRANLRAGRTRQTQRHPASRSTRRAHPRVLRSGRLSGDINIDALQARATHVRVELGRIGANHDWVPNPRSSSKPRPYSLARAPSTSRRPTTDYPGVLGRWTLSQRPSHPQPSGR